MPDNNHLPQRKRMRLQGYDYALPGNYFVTIVTHERACLFGDVVSGEMQLNDAGRMVESSYLKLGQDYDGIDCLDYVIMPNHLHFIIRLLSDNHSLPEIIKRLKSKTTINYIHGVREQGWSAFDKHLWQPNYYDHIIRNERVFNLIRGYIFQNPERWYYDKINPECSATPDDLNQAIKSLM